MKWSITGPSGRVQWDGSAHVSGVPADALEYMRAEGLVLPATPTGGSIPVDAPLSEEAAWTLGECYAGRGWTAQGTPPTFTTDFGDPDLTF